MFLALTTKMFLVVQPNKLGISEWELNHWIICIILENPRKIQSEIEFVMNVGNDVGGLLGTAQTSNSLSDSDSDIGAPIKRLRSIFMNIVKGRMKFAIYL